MHRGLPTVVVRTRIVIIWQFAGSSWKLHRIRRDDESAHIIVIIIYIYSPSSSAHHHHQHSRNGINGVKLLRGVGITHIYIIWTTHIRKTIIALYIYIYIYTAAAGTTDGWERFREGGGLSNGLFGHPYGGVEEGKKNVTIIIFPAARGLTPSFV